MQQQADKHQQKIQTVLQADQKQGVLERKRYQLT